MYAAGIGNDSSFEIVAIFAGLDDAECHLKELRNRLDWIDDPESNIRIDEITIHHYTRRELK